jgi:hypothetical protein
MVKKTKQTKFSQETRSDEKMDWINFTSEGNDVHEKTVGYMVFLDQQREYRKMYFQKLWKGGE